MSPQIACFFSALLFSLTGVAQPAMPEPLYVSLPAGAYQKSFLHHWLLGTNWRQEWDTPVEVAVVTLDTLYGGLTPYQRGGGGESKSLRLRSKDGHEYVLRSIDKYRGKGVPGILKITPYKSLVQDGISMSHPYAAFAIPHMMQAAGLYHTKPRLVYIPVHAALDSFNATYGDDLYLLEERPYGTWAGVSHLGGFDRYISSAELKAKMQSDNRYNVDAQMYIKARLMDILLADVDRHEGNWRWGTMERDSFRFIPIALDRDQAFFKHNGLLSGLAIRLARFRSIESFKSRIKKLHNLTSHDRLLDAYITNSMKEQEWIAAARSLQASLTDAVITQSVSNMPTEVHTLSGNEIITKLQQRRADLHLYASRYYKTLVQQVDINGTAQKETFEVVKSSSNEITVTLFRHSEKNKEAYFSKKFTPTETKQITIYGFGGEDVFSIDSTIVSPRIVVQPGVNRKQLPMVE